MAYGKGRKARKGGKKGRKSTSKGRKTLRGSTTRPARHFQGGGKF